MIKKLLCLLLTLCLALPQLSGGAAGLSAENPPERYLVGLNAPLAGAMALSEDDSLTPLNQDGTVFSTTDPQALTALAGADQIAFIEPDYPVEALGLTNDEKSDLLWHLDYLRADTAWDQGLTGDGVRVAVLDSGILAEHEDFADVAILPGKDYTGSGTVADSQGHGTFVAGLIAARRNNGVGVAGLTDDVTLVPLRVLQGRNGSTSSVVSAVYDAVDLYHCDVLNLSLGSKEYSVAEHAAIEYAVSRGALVVTAAGNDGSSILYYPAALDCTVGVGYINSNGIIAEGSQRNKSVDVVAPGVDLASTSSSGVSKYALGSGSSFSTPLVSSMAVMAKQICPSITQSAFSSLLKASARDAGAPGYDTSYGWGTADIPAFLEAVREYAAEEETLAPFTDLKNHWARPYIAQAITSGLLKGTSATRFAPDQTTTRAMAVTVLARMSGDDLGGYPSVFTDVASGSWYASSVNWAVATGVATGVSPTSFAPDRPLTREALAAFLYRYALSAGARPAVAEHLDEFVDGDATSGWAQEALNWAVEVKIINGSGGRLNPQGTATRAELATMLVRLQNVLA